MSLNPVFTMWKTSLCIGEESYGMEESLCEGLATIQDLIYVKAED